MRIVYLSYAYIAERNAEAWLKRLNFYTRQLEAMTRYAEVHSIHLINSKGTIVMNDVTYHFVCLKKEPGNPALSVASIYFEIAPRYNYDSWNYIPVAGIVVEISAKKCGKVYLYTPC